MMNFTSSEALQYFDERVINIANASGKTVIDWDEVFTNFTDTLDPSQVIIQLWHGTSLVPDVVQAGFRAILADQVVFRSINTYLAR